jgi:hypothetical protein
MTEARHQWHVAHDEALEELVAAFIHASPRKTPLASTIADLLLWSAERAREPVNEPAVCSHCGEAYAGDDHVCPEGQG